MILEAWNKRRNLFIEGNKFSVEGGNLFVKGDRLCAKGSKMFDKGNKLSAEGYKLRVEGSKLHAEGCELLAESKRLNSKGDKLCVEGDLIFINAVITVYGDVDIEWDEDDVIVEGVRYKFLEKAACEGKVVGIDGLKYKLVSFPDQRQ